MVEGDWECELVDGDWLSLIKVDVDDEPLQGVRV